MSCIVQLSDCPSYFMVTFILKEHKKLQMSLHMAEPSICTGENKGADQLHSNCEADRRLRFSLHGYSFLIQNFQLLAIFCACTARFVSDLFGGHIVGSSTRRLRLYYKVNIIMAYHNSMLIILESIWKNITY